MRKMLLAIPALVSLSACMMMQPPQGGATGSSSTQSSGSGSMNEPAKPSSEPASTSEPAEKKAPVPVSIEVHSDCPQTLPLFIGEKPGYGSGLKTSISSNSTTSFGRRPDGTQMIWIIDESEKGLASVNVTAETTRVEIDRDCKKITAR